MKFPLSLRFYLGDLSTQEKKSPPVKPKPKKNKQLTFKLK